MSLCLRLLGIAAAATLSLGILVYLLHRLRLAAHAHDFIGKVVIVTGASRGIGRALACAFAQRGAHLVLAARSVGDLEAVAAECRMLHPHAEVLAVPTDVTDEAQLEHLVALTLEHFGRVDILVNNAGVRMGGAFTELDPSLLRRQIEINLLATMRLTQMVLPTMIQRGQGWIVNVASQAGRHTEPYFVVYGASKHGVIGFSEGLRRELAATGVRVLTVSPGFTDTEMVTAIGPVYRRMGFPMIPPQRVARRTLEGILLGLPEVNIGWLETLGGYASVFAPRLADLYWRLFMPRDFPQAAARQRSR